MKKKHRYRFDASRYTKYAIGALFTNDNKMAKEHPDTLGELDIPLVLLEDLCSQMRQTDKAKVSLAGYNNVSKDGEHYVTLTGKLPKGVLVEKTWQPDAAVNVATQHTSTSRLFDE